MSNKFSYQNFLEKIISFSPRQGQGEKRTADFLKQYLQVNQINFCVQKFNVYIPEFVKAELKIDGRPLIVEANGLVSGKIEGKDNLVSNLLPLSAEINFSNLNFNPNSDFISRADHYFFPALCFSRKDLPKILKAKKVSGQVVVKKKKHQAENILVGNCQNPKKIVFAHYDSINTGYIDNGTGVAVMMADILERKQEDVLYIFSACEELVFDDIYWGYGFRVFEKKYRDALEKAKKIIVADCLGNGLPVLSQDEELLQLGFPIKNLSAWKQKIFFLTTNNFEHLMSLYHSLKDDGRGVKKEFLQMAQKKLEKSLK